MPQPRQMVWEGYSSDGDWGCLLGVKGWDFPASGDGAVLPVGMVWGHPLGSGGVWATPQLEDESGPWVGK